MRGLLVERARTPPSFKLAMTNPMIAATAVFLLASSLNSAGQPPAASEKLFNGANLEGWSHVLIGEGVKREDVWSVKDGVLICKGKPTGYLFTKESYQDFTFSFEWRWADEAQPGNSGVLLRIAGEPKTFMPKCVEAQLKSGSAGDIWAFFGASVDGDAARKMEVKDHKELGTFKGIKGMKVAEKKPGEWNRYEIKLSGGELELKINGELVNRASGLDVLSGPIGLQSEGAEIHFRNIELRMIP